MTSRAAGELAAQAGAGRFALQLGGECGTVQYPPRDVCGRCLSGELRWAAVANTGTVLAATVARVSVEAFFRARLPWRIGLVALDCGPVAVVHLAAWCDAGARVRVGLQLDHEGRGVLCAGAA